MNLNTISLGPTKQIKKDPTSASIYSCFCCVVSSVVKLSWCPFALFCGFFSSSSVGLGSNSVGSQLQTSVRWFSLLFYVLFLRHAFKNRPKFVLLFQTLREVIRVSNFEKEFQPVLKVPIPTNLIIVGSPRWFSQAGYQICLNLTNWKKLN
jgi:hypothetical protein